MVSARTTRANRVQSTTTIAAMTEVSPAPITATSTTKKKRPTSALPSQSRCPPRATPASHRDGRSTGPLTATSTMTQPRVQQRHQHIDREVEGDEEDGEGQDQPLDQRKIAVDHR